MNKALGSWHEGASRTAIVDFVGRVTDEGSGDFEDFDRLSGAITKHYKGAKSR